MGFIYWVTYWMYTGAERLPHCNAAALFQTCFKLVSNMPKPILSDSIWGAPKCSRP